MHTTSDLVADADDMSLIDDATHTSSGNGGQSHAWRVQVLLWRDACSLVGVVLENVLRHLPDLQDVVLSH